MVEAQDEYHEQVDKEAQKGKDRADPGKPATSSDGQAGTDQHAGTKENDQGRQVALEFRYTYVKPTWNVEGRRVETTLGTKHFNLGLGVHY